MNFRKFVSGIAPSNLFYFRDDSDLSHGLQVNSDAKLVFIDLNNRLANYIEAT
jgi:hypothetical protein